MRTRNNFTQYLYHSVLHKYDMRHFKRWQMT